MCGISETLDHYDKWNNPPNINGVDDVNKPQTNVSNRIFILTNVKHNYKTFEAN